MTGVLLPAGTLLWREVVRFCRQRSRVVGALAQPLLFWLLLGGGLGASFRPAGAPPGTGYLEYFYPGMIALVVLFTAVFATISTVEDRQRGFLQGVLVAPIPRASVILGQALGGTTLALGQGLLLLLVAPLLGISLTAASVLAAAAVMVLMAFALTSLGLVIAWRIDSMQGFHAIMNLILFPLWLLSGAFFPASGVPPWLHWIMRLDPLTYSVAALRRALYLGHPASAGPIPSLGASLAVTGGFALLAFLAATAVARRSPS